MKLKNHGNMKDVCTLNDEGKVAWLNGRETEI